MSDVDYEKNNANYSKEVPPIDGDVYADIGTSTEMGHVKRGLKSRHIQFIALGGTIGTGLFLGIGSALSTSGPLSILLGYSMVGIAIFGMMQCLGEMTTWLPLPGAIPQLASRYVDDALGFAVGWNQWYNCAATLCVEISAASIVIGYWDKEQKINPGVWIAIIIVLVLCLNIFAVEIYGEAEFCFAGIKIITIVGLILLAFILDLGGGPSHDRLGFRYWDPPMLEYIAKGSEGRFLGLFQVFIQAAFSYGGVEMVAVAAGEAENPRKNIPKAVRRVFWRILFFYVIGTLAVGVLCPANDPNLLNPNNVGAAASPWVIAIQRAGISGLPSIINAVILTSASSSANAFLYTGSRYLYALASQGQAPRFLQKCTKKGIPIWCVLITASIALLTFMTISSGGNKVFGWFANIVTIANLLTWIIICISYIRFHKALLAQGVDRNTLPFKSHFQPYNAWVALIFFVIVVFFNGFSVFTKGKWNVQNFVVAYIGLPLFGIFFLFWKLVKRTKLRSPTEVDLFTGKAAIDAEYWPEQHPRNFLEKIWFWIA